MSTNIPVPSPQDLQTDMAGAVGGQRLLPVCTHIQVSATLLFYVFSAFIHAVDKRNTIRSLKRMIDCADGILRSCSATEKDNHGGSLMLMIMLNSGDG